MNISRRLPIVNLRYAIACFLLLLMAAPASAGRSQPPPVPPRHPSQTDIQLFFEGDWDPAARAAVEHAATVWEGLIDSPVPVEIGASWGWIPVAVPAMVYGERVQSDQLPHPDVWYPSVLADAIEGYDSTGPVDFSIAFNDDITNWYTGLDGAPPAGAYDLVTVALKYIGIGLGLDSAMTLCGPDASLGCWDSGGGSYSYPGLFDLFAVTGAGQPLLALANQSEALHQVLTSDDVYFSGPGATAANGGNRPKLYAPASWSGIAYPLLLDDAVFATTPNALMTHTLHPGQAIHHPGPIALAMLHDLGWQVSPAAPALVSVYLPLIERASTP